MTGIDRSMNIVELPRPIRSRPWLAYPLAIALSLGAAWIRFEIGDLLAGFPFLTFFGAVVLAAFLGGLGPGILAAVLSGLMADYFLIAPTGKLALAWPSGWIAMGFYAGTTATIVALMHFMVVAHEKQKRSEVELRALNADLERIVEERTADLRVEMLDRSEAQAQVRQLQKMESIGQLTGGVAHDFNNMLAIIIGSLDMAKRRLTGSEHPKVAEAIDNAAEGARRAATLTARLLAYSRQQPLEPKALDANKLVAGMSEMLRRSIGEPIIVETVLAGGLWPTFADAAQLENAIVNLAVNARDAMPNGGKLTIETANTDLDDRYARSHEEVAAGQYVMISVSDTGTGMAPEVMERAFDPFYTTKGVGKGTGLGLSQVYGYIKQSGGHVKIYSEAGQGTTIKLYLPRHARAAATDTQRPAPAALPTGSPEQIILVVEDEAQVRHMTVDALRELGYTVVQAADANQALEQLAVQPRIDLLFTDIVMPGMNGRQLADKARESRPDLRILFTTGYTRNAVVHNGMLDAGVAFLPKPFTIEQLALKIADAIAGHGDNRPA